MRVERISETQLKFVLMTDDLEARDIKMNELSYASDKTQRLFREIMTMVQDECEFTEGEAPLMFEAMRVGVDSLVVMVTKISEAMQKEHALNLIPSAKQDCRFKKSDIIKQPEISGAESCSIFSFDSIDLLAAGIARLPQNFKGESQVYKMNARFYLILSNETEDTRPTSELEAVLHEYGQKHVSNTISRQYLAERGQVFIAENAAEKLRAY
ncbi:MAG: adaptor protein MecA [Defluviitaleaceae bacterium]|nr:adaptor protein MecA [Defluviitaleaceae bacterium]